MNLSLFLNTDFRDSNDSWGQLVGNVAFSPYRFFLGGRVITHLDMESQKLNVKESSPRIWSHSRHWTCTAAVIVLVALPTLIGVVIKGIDYLVSPTVKKKYQILAFSYQFLQWKEAIEKDPSKKLEDFIVVKDKDRDVLLSFLLRIVNKDPRQKKFLIPLLKELFAKPFHKNFNVLLVKELFSKEFLKDYDIRYVKENGIAFKSLWKDIKTFFEKSREAGTEEEDLTLITDSIVEDKVQGVLKAWWLSTQVFDCSDHWYNFLCKIAGKLSQEQREEFHRFYTNCPFPMMGNIYKDVYELAFFSYLSEDDRVDYLTKICCKKNHCGFSSNMNKDPYQVQATPEVVKKTIEGLIRSYKPFKNRLFLVTALQSNFQIYFPLFQALDSLTKWRVFIDPDLQDTVRLKCENEMKRTFQGLSVSRLVFVLEMTELKYYPYIHEWITKAQLQDLWKSLNKIWDPRIDRIRGYQFFSFLLQTLPNDPMMIRRFLLSIKKKQLDSMPYNILKIPYYVSCHFFALLNVDKPLPNRFNVSEEEVKMMMCSFCFYIFEEKRTDSADLQKLLSLIIPAISPRILPSLLKGFLEFCSTWDFTKHSRSDSNNPLFKQIFSYASFKRWKESVVNDNFKGMEACDFYRKVIPELEQFESTEEELIRKQFQKFCIILEEFLSEDSFQVPILELEEKEKKILEEIFVLLKTKISSLQKICTDVIRKKAIAYNEPGQIPLELMERINLSIPPDHDYRVKMASLEEITKNSLREEVMEGKNLVAIANSIAEDPVQGVLKLWWLGTEKLNLFPKQFYNFVRFISEKFSPENKKELCQFYRSYPCDNDIFILAIYPALPNEEALDCAERLCQRKELTFDVVVDKHRLFSSKKSLCEIRMTSSALKTILTRITKRSGSKKLKGEKFINFEDINIGFLAAALQTDYERSIPFFQKSHISIAFPVHQYLNPDNQPCKLKEELEKKMPNLELRS